MENIIENISVYLEPTAQDFIATYPEDDIKLSPKHFYFKMEVSLIDDSRKTAIVSPPFRVKFVKGQWVSI